MITWIGVCKLRRVALPANHHMQETDGHIPILCDPDKDESRTKPLQGKLCFFGCHRKSRMSTWCISVPMTECVTSTFTREHLYCAGTDYTCILLQVSGTATIVPLRPRMRLRMEATVIPRNYPLLRLTKHNDAMALHHRIIDSLNARMVCSTHVKRKTSGADFRYILGTEFPVFLGVAHLCKVCFWCDVHGMKIAGAGKVD
mmetsp:Transcript_129523/g.242305  ORF Transcript_129523/g.242305 Transcript_129523/m.242305 type:complete len:201 (+) Transcript_129523:233-835(+)